MVDDVRPDPRPPGACAPASAGHRARRAHSRRTDPFVVRVPGSSRWWNGMDELPTGLVTLLFTDVQGSTRLLEQLGHRYAAVLTGHDTILRTSIQDEGGRVVDTAEDRKSTRLNSSHANIS